jgi:large subunit ribosomal protein L25
MKKVELSATARPKTGTTGATLVRREKRVPCVLYGDSGTVHFSVDEAALKKIVFTPESYRIELDIDGQKRMALLHQKQFHPVSDAIIHCDFMEMSDTKEARVSLGLKLTGQSAGVKKGGILNQTMRKLRVKGLPSVLPEHLELDITNLEIGKSIHVSDLKFEGITVAEKPSDVVVSVKMAKKEEEVAPAAAAAAPAAGAAAPAAGAAATPAAGADAKKAEPAKPAGKK